jgi:hypothetical protein
MIIMGKVLGLKYVRMRIADIPDTEIQLVDL